MLRVFYGCLVENPFSVVLLFARVRIIILRAYYWLFSMVVVALAKKLMVKCFKELKQPLLRFELPAP